MNTTIGGHMKDNFFKKYLPSIFFVLLFFAGTCWGQSKKEAQFLGMFYEDKDLVVSSTRNGKNISQVAENITVVTAKDIDAMNAHTVAEVLNTVPGVFVNSNRDFGAYSLITIQGSEERHVLVLVDNVPWNFLSSGSSETSSIPVGIIDRIEIIKGPASSAWGSSLGGVINIITKKTGTAEKPAGTVSAAYGKNNSRDYRAEISGMAGAVGYYVYAGGQGSDGLLGSRYFNNKSLYSKIDVPVSEKVDLGFTASYSVPRYGFEDLPLNDISSASRLRSFYATGSLKAALAKGLDFKLSFHKINQKFTQDNKALGLGFTGPQGAPYLESICDEKTSGARGQLVWTKGVHSAVLGMDYESGNLEQINNAGAFLQSLGAPAETMATPENRQWAVYVNDSISVGKWSVTPGIRYDYDSISGSFISPSLGVTYRLSKETVLRGSVSRGFTTPPLSSSSGGGLFLDPNPSLKSEEVGSYQVGMESYALDYIRVKATFFRDDLNNILIRELYGAGPPSFNDIIINKGSSKRQGLEFESETVPFYNLTFLTGFSYSAISPPNEIGASDIYTIDIGIRYDDNESIRARLSGRYVQWDVNPVYLAENGDFIWDFNINKKLMASADLITELFMNAHNIFNGSQYTYVDKKNPGRWLEAGIKIKF
jgi:vitamin B12 transporter